MIKRMFIWILGTLVLFFLVGAIVGWSLSEAGHSGSVSDHFDGNTFKNQNGIAAKGPLAVFKWIMKRDAGPWSKNYETTTGPAPAPASDELVITFVNHSTFLIQWKGLNILTDPVWSERCSPFAFAGPQRMRPPGIAFDDLPKIDLVLISHNHYDHLDKATIMQLQQRFAPRFVLPLGVGGFFKRNGINHFIELDWWQSEDSTLQITATPAQHFSGRGMFDRDKTLWCGFVLTDGTSKVYYAGDSGYGPFFKEIGDHLGPMDVSMIPIGAYLPRWFMSPIHISPDQSVQVHQDVRSVQSIAMHFGTFPLADEGQGKAESDLLQAMSQQGISPEAFIIPDEGMPIHFGF